MHTYSSECKRTTALSLLALISLGLAYGLNVAAKSVSFEGGWLIGPPAFGGIFAALYKFTDRSWWKLSILHQLGVVEEKNISGAYEGTLISDYHGGTQRKIRLDITQSWTRILIKMTVHEGDTSSSYSIAASYQDLGDGSARIVYTYHNQPSPGLADLDMNPHDGTAQIEISKSGALNGRYFNGRRRGGSIRLQKV